jgi:predicted transcriptional regulator
MGLFKSKSPGKDAAKLSNPSQFVAKQPPPASTSSANLQVVMPSGKSQASAEVSAMIPQSSQNRINVQGAGTILTPVSSTITLKEPPEISSPAAVTAPSQTPGPTSQESHGTMILASSQKEKAGDEMVTTGVDDLIKLLHEYPKLSVDEVSRRLNVSKSILKSWIDFLVEEKILGIEYSFTTPYVYLNKAPEVDKTKKTTELKLTYNMFRQEFCEKAKADKIPAEKIPAFWQGHLQPLLEANKDFFLREVRKRNLPKGEDLWQRYMQDALAS